MLPSTLNIHLPKVHDVAHSAIPEHERNGFSFKDATPAAVEITIKRAVDAYKLGWDWWQDTLVPRAMRQVWRGEVQDVEGCAQGVYLQAGFRLVAGHIGASRHAPGEVLVEVWRKVWRDRCGVWRGARRVGGGGAFKLGWDWWQDTPVPRAMRQVRCGWVGGEKCGETGVKRGVQGWGGGLQARLGLVAGYERCCVPGAEGRVGL